MESIFDSNLLSFFGKSGDASRSRTLSEISSNKQYSGTVSIINVDVEIANKTFSIIPKHGGTLAAVKTETMKRLEAHFNITIEKKFQDAFSFFVGRTQIPKNKEPTVLEKLLEEGYQNHRESFHGDIVTVILKIKDCSLEYELLQLIIPRFLVQSTAAAYRVRQIHKMKGRVRNRVVKLEHSLESYSLNICNVRGDIRDSFILRNLILSHEGKMKLEGQDYFLVILQLRKTHDGKNSSIEDLYFNSEEDVMSFFDNIHEFQHLQEDFEEEEEDEEIKPKKEDSILKSKILGNEKSLKKLGSLKYTREASFIEEGLKTTQILGGQSFILQELKMSLVREYQQRRNSIFSKVESEIQKTFRDKQMLKLESHEWTVKTLGGFGVRLQRYLRVNEDFEWILFKKEKEADNFPETYNYVFHFPMLDMLKVKPRAKDNSKIEVIFKNEKKYPKPLQIDFMDEKDGDRFMDLIKRIVKLFTQSRNSFKTEKEQTENDKAYSWLIGPKLDQLNVEFDRGEMQTIQFKVINITNFAEDQIARLNLKTSILSLKLPDGSSEKKIALEDIQYCETELADPRGLNLLFKSRKSSFLFCDNRSRLLFEAAIYESIMPKYKLSSKKSFEPEKIKVYSTTFNAGNASPSKDLDLWLAKSKECDVIAIAMQECDTSRWYDTIQTYYGGSNFVLVSQLAMWRMHLIVYVRTEYFPFVNSVLSSSKATGLADLLGNKGGVAISFKILETSFCFVGCHLAASPEKLALRKNNFYNLMKFLRLGDERIEMTAAFDYFFFMGDVNFRLDCDFYFALNAVNQDECEGLLYYDQLLKARKNDNFMTLFKEGKITFKPTYRRNREDSGYSNKRGQSPSWTDRILVKSRPSSEAELLVYDSDEMFFLSDHRPTYAIFKCKVDPPYLPERPIFLRDPNYVGVLKFAYLRMSYDYQQHEQMNEFEEPFVWPLSITIYFRAKFLGKYAMTLPLEVKTSTSIVTWDQKLIPYLYCIIPDSKYLKNNCILTVIKAKREDEVEPLMGQADIPLNTLMENQGAKTEFETEIHLYGRIFGVLKGAFVFERP